MDNTKTPQPAAAPTGLVDPDGSVAPPAKDVLLTAEEAAKAIKMVQINMRWVNRDTHFEGPLIAETDYALLKAKEAKELSKAAAPATPTPGFMEGLRPPGKPSKGGSKPKPG